MWSRQCAVCHKVTADKSRRGLQVAEQQDHKTCYIHTCVLYSMHVGLLGCYVGFSLLCIIVPPLRRRCGGLCQHTHVMYPSSD